MGVPHLVEIFESDTSDFCVPVLGKCKESFHIATPFLNRNKRVSPVLGCGDLLFLKVRFAWGLPERTVANRISHRMLHYDTIHAICMPCTLYKACIWHELMQLTLTGEC